MQKSEKSEYNEYYETYVSLVNETDITAAFEKQLNEMRDFFGAISEEKSMFAYAEGKWTIKEIVGHLIDGERIFGYRALRISRGDETPIEGFEQDGYVENAHFNDYKFSDLVDEFSLVRKSNISFFKHLKEIGLDANGNGERQSGFGSRARFYNGRSRSHHAKILSERYL